jgi:Flp pilus assembly protein TadB
MFLRSYIKRLQFLLAGYDILEISRLQNETKKFILLFPFLNNYLQHKKRLQLEADLPGFILALSCCLQSGVEPIVAFSKVSSLMPTKSFIYSVGNELNVLLSQDSSEIQALQIINKRYGECSKILELLVRAMLISKSEGASLLQLLKRLHAFASQRQIFLKKVRIATTSHKVSSIGILICALFLLFLQLSIGGVSISDINSSLIGKVIALLGASLIILGVVFTLILHSKDLS